MILNTHHHPERPSCRSSVLPWFLVSHDAEKPSHAGDDGDPGWLSVGDQALAKVNVETILRNIDADEHQAPLPSLHMRARSAALATVRDHRTSGGGTMLRIGLDNPRSDRAPPATAEAILRRLRESSLIQGAFEERVSKDGREPRLPSCSIRCGRRRFPPPPGRRRRRTALWCIRAWARQRFPRRRPARRPCRPS